METIFIILVSGTLNAVCFFIGARIGQKVSKGETIEAPTLNPMKAIREREERKEADKESERLEIILQNIENYDGSPNGQRDVPRW